MTFGCTVEKRASKCAENISMHCDLWLLHLNPVTNNDIKLGLMQADAADAINYSAHFRRKCRYQNVASDSTGHIDDWRHAKALGDVAALTSHGPVYDIIV